MVTSSAHVLVQGNACSGNRNGIGLFSNEIVADPGHYVIGANRLYDNEVDLFHSGAEGAVLNEVRIDGMLQLRM